jgi:hypothetical protein
MSKIHSGLFSLAKSGFIDLTFQRSKPTGRVPGDPPWTSWIQVTRSADRDVRLLVIDLSDQSYVFSMEALERCDVYFKRDYHQPDIRVLPANLRTKIQPYGLNYGCRTAETTWRIPCHFLSQLCVHALRSPGKAWARRRIHVTNLYEFKDILLVDEYEQPPDRPVEAAVVFQPKVIPNKKIPEFEERINRPRVELVRRLKKEFGPAFWGGVIPNAHTRQYYPDAITKYSTRRHDYVELTKRALVAVYSRGYHESLAYKLPEYLAASKCIVAEPLRNELPRPLIAGAHYLEFNSPDECVEQCARLLQDEPFAKEMQCRNWEYYQAEVRPSQHLANLLHRAFTPSETQTI